MGVNLGSDKILRALANARLEADRRGGDLTADPANSQWVRDIARLQAEATPKTYLAVVAVCLVARSLFADDELDVTHLKKSTGPLGYSAASIGSKIASFAKEQGIDLRSRSTQPMNNQPFTFKAKIEPDMGAQTKHSEAFEHFYEVAQRVNALEPAEARLVLALLFHLSPVSEPDRVDIEVTSASLADLLDLCEELAGITARESEGGRLGQALVAAVLDVAFNPSGVVLGAVNDPDRGNVGDVHVLDESGRPWLWAEVKQKAVATGDVSAFVSRVRDAGGGRVIYAALENHRFSGHINVDRCVREAAAQGVELTVSQSPGEFLQGSLWSMPGGHARRVEALLRGFHTRAREAGCTARTLAQIESLIVEVT